MAPPASAFGGSTTPDPTPARVPRFPWISLVVMILGFVAVVTAIGLAISAGVQSSNDDRRALDDAVRLASDQRAQVQVAGPDDVIHVYVDVPSSASAWRADGTLVYPTRRPVVARQDGTRLLPDDVLSFTDGFGYGDPGTLSDTTQVQIDDIHPLRAGNVEFVTQDLAPADQLLLVTSPSRSAVGHRLAVAGILAAVAGLVGLAAFVTFIVMVVRRQQAKPRPNPPPPTGPYQPYGTYPSPPYGTYPMATSSPPPGPGLPPPPPAS